VAYNDVDYCLKLMDKGYRVLYTPHAKLYHYEAFSKKGEDRDPRIREMKAFQAKWKRYVDADPFYNPNLTRSAEDFSFRKKSS
jgi:GT2 family glycosyltransferase